VEIARLEVVKQRRAPLSIGVAKSARASNGLARHMRAASHSSPDVLSDVLADNLATEDIMRQNRSTGKSGY